MSSKTEIQEILQLAPEWSAILDSLLAGIPADGASSPVFMARPAEKPKDPVAVGPYELFQRLGAKSIYKKAQTLGGKQEQLLKLIRDHFYQPMLQKMVTSNQNLRRFWSQRRVPPDVQRSQALSFSVELAQKMEGVLKKQLAQMSEDGFKVLLPAYVQRSVHNAVIDHIRDEWEWERSTLQDLNLDPEQEDPRQNTADDPRYAPENQAISNEQVTQLNQLRVQLQAMLGNSRYQQEPLQVIDCIFGLGLTPHSKVGVEMTMRECCDKLNIHGETQARKIARCQVFLDKGMDMIRQVIREKLPGIAEAWQAEVNVNSASRRELTHYLGLTENEVERLIVSRQYHALLQLVERAVVKQPRLAELEQRGAVAAFIPVDVNSATARDIIDILGLSKELANKLVAERPFESLVELKTKKILDQELLQKISSRGAVLKRKTSAKKPDLNRAPLEELVGQSIDETVAERLIRGRPFATWSELEEFLGLEPAAWVALRQKFCLGLIPD